MDISLVIPLFNEEESLPELVAWIQRVAEPQGWALEAILVDDGSNDGSWAVVRQLAEQYTFVRGIRFRRNYGKAAALHTGFQAARGRVVVTMDADLQDSPDELPELYRMITEEGYDLVSGWKKRRHDPMGKTLPSKLFNWTMRKATGIKLHDFNCGLKAYRNEVVKSIEVYGEMHRHIPFLAKAAGFQHIGEKVVEHRARQYGYSKYGMKRLITGFLDFLSITFVLRYGRKPMHFFGMWGVLVFLIGFILTVWVLGVKQYLIWQERFEDIREVTDQPLFYLALVALIIGVQLFTAGYLGELTSRNFPDRNLYEVSEEVGQAT